MREYVIRRYATRALLAVGVALLAGACASSALTSGRTFEGTYTADFEQVNRAATEAVRAVGLGMEEGQTLNDGTHFILAYKERSLSRERGRYVRSVTLHVYTEREGPQQTHVYIEIPGQRGSYSSIRGNEQEAAHKYARRVLRELEDRL